MKGAPPAEKLSAKSGEAIPILSDVIETHRLEVANGAPADELAEWVRQERPGFDAREYGFREFRELLNYAQGKSVVRIVAMKNWVSLCIWALSSTPGVTARAGRCG